jgi:hypothetical protein
MATAMIGYGDENPPLNYILPPASAAQAIVNPLASAAAATLARPPAHVSAPPAVDPAP